jgi:NADH-quinone oxidoreductase subunit G
LNQIVKDGKCKRILSINEEVFKYGLSYATPPDVEMFYIGTENDKAAKRAAIAIPSATIFETTGTFINKDWRLQRFHRAVNPPNKNIFPMWYIFSLLLNVYSGSSGSEMFWVDEVWEKMSKSVDLLEDIDLKNVDPRGILLKKS